LKALDERIAAVLADLESEIAGAAIRRERMAALLDQASRIHEARTRTDRRRNAALCGLYAVTVVSAVILLHGGTRSVPVHEAADRAVLPGTGDAPRSAPRGSVGCRFGEQTLEVLEMDRDGALPRVGARDWIPVVAGSWTGQVPRLVHLPSNVYCCRPAWSTCRLLVPQPTR